MDGLTEAVLYEEAEEVVGLLLLVQSSDYGVGVRERCFPWSILTVEHCITGVVSRLLTYRVQRVLGSGEYQNAGVRLGHEFLE